jgi:hypothetical protein
MRNIRVGDARLDIHYKKSADALTIEADRSGTGDCWLEFSPALSLRAEVVSVELNGRPLVFKVQPNQNDQHVLVRFPVAGSSNALTIRVRNDFGLTVTNELPPLGSASRDLRVISESWNAARNQLTMGVSGRAGSRYELGVWNAGQVSSVDGGTLNRSGKLQIQMPQGEAESYTSQSLTIHFAR